MWAMRVLGVATCAVLLAGCAQSGADGGLTTGSLLPALPSAASLLPSLSSSEPVQKAERVSGNLYRLRTDDRAISDQTQRENYALLRAAETAKEVGGTHFVVVNSTEQTNLFGFPASGQSAATTMIRVLKVEPGTPSPIGAISADEIVHFFGPQFGRESPRQG